MTIEDIKQILINSTVKNIYNNNLDNNPNLIEKIKSKFPHIAEYEASRKAPPTSVLLVNDNVDDLKKNSRAHTSFYMQRIRFKFNKRNRHTSSLPPSKK